MEAQSGSTKWGAIREGGPAVILFSFRFVSLFVWGFFVCQ